LSRRIDHCNLVQMSTVAEIKAAIARLTLEERAEVARCLHVNGSDQRLALTQVITPLAGRVEERHSHPLEGNPPASTTVAN